jgi:hypothetical protein
VPESGGVCAIALDPSFAIRSSRPRTRFVADFPRNSGGLSMALSGGGCFQVFRFIPISLSC